MSADSATASPLPIDGTFTVTMSFYDALREVVEHGKRATKLEWGDEKSFMFIRDERLKIALPDGTAHDFVIRDADVLGMDWMLVDK